MPNCGLMVGTAGCNHKGPSLFLGGQSVNRLNVFDIANFFAETVNMFRPVAVFAEELRL